MNYNKYQIVQCYGSMRYTICSTDTLDNAIRLATSRFNHVMADWKKAEEEHHRRPPKPSVMIYEAKWIVDSEGGRPL